MRATITQWPRYGEFGFATDQEGRQIFVHQNDLDEAARKDVSDGVSLRGLVFECEVQPPRSSGRAPFATNVFIIEETEKTK